MTPVVNKEKGSHHDDEILCLKLIIEFFLFVIGI